MIASKHASTSATPYRSKSSPSRRAPMRHAEHSASRSAASDSGIRELRVMIVSAARLGTPASQSRIGGTISPPPNTGGAWGGIEPGPPPPVSAWGPQAPPNAGGRGGRPRAGPRPPVCRGVAEGPPERHPPPAREPPPPPHKVGAVGHSPPRGVGVVVEEDVSLPHLPDGEVAGDRVDERG